MIPETLEELDRCIEQEQLQVTAEVFAEAWDEATAEGIRPNLIAEAAAHSLFARLLAQTGESEAKALLAEIQTALDCGHYLPPTSIQ